MKYMLNKYYIVKVILFFFFLLKRNEVYTVCMKNAFTFVQKYLRSRYLLMIEIRFKFSMKTFIDKNFYYSIV